jgi:hypothetical protein
LLDVASASFRPRFQGTVDRDIGVIGYSGGAGGLVADRSIVVDRYLSICSRKNAEPGVTRFAADDEFTDRHIRAAGDSQRAIAARSHGGIAKIGSRSVAINVNFSHTGFLTTDVGCLHR